MARKIASPAVKKQRPVRKRTIPKRKASRRKIIRVRTWEDQELLRMNHLAQS